MNLTPVRILLLATTLCFSLLLPAQCHTELRGTCTGQKLYVQHPAKADGSWCTDSIKLNGKPVAFEKAGAFEIDPAAYNIQPCDTMQLVFMHDCGCKPKLITEMHPPGGKVGFTSVTIDSTGKLEWSVRFDCSGPAPLIGIESKRREHWHRDTLMGMKPKPVGTYTAQVHSYPGKNVYRIAAYQYMGKRSWYSDSVVYYNPAPPITWQYDATQTTITFSDTTRFEIVDEKGKVIQSLSRSKAFTLVKTKAKKRWMYFANNPEPVLLDIPKKRKTLALTLPM